jgi:peptidoglycan/xylan/chitin deacetylase (PgdA/CDA1 family)
MNRAAVLTYHNIGAPPKGAKLRGLYVRPRMFAFHMLWLAIAGFNVGTLDDMLAFSKGRGSRKRLVALTFDDGYADFYRNAYPVLKRCRFPAAIFVLSDPGLKENAWDAERLNMRKRLLSGNEIEELKRHDISFGCHTKTHPRLSTLSDRDIESEVSGSKGELEARLGRPVRFFCYPYGDFDQRVVAEVKQAGYAAAFTEKRGFVYSGDDPFALKRIPIRLNTHPLALIWKLHTNYEEHR